MGSLGEVIKKMAVGANDANAPTSVLFGTVTSVNPLEITVEQKLKLTPDQKARAKALRMEAREQMRPIIEAIKTKKEQKEISAREGTSDWMSLFAG